MLGMDILEEPSQIDRSSGTWVQAVSKLLINGLEKKMALDAATWMDGMRIPFWPSRNIETDREA